MEYLILALVLICFLLLLTLVIKSFSTRNSSSHLQDSLAKEFQQNRIELADSLRTNREELHATIDKLTGKLEQKLKEIDATIHKNNSENRKETSESLKIFGEVFAQNIKEFNELQERKFEVITKKQEELVKTTELKLEKMRETVDEKLHKTLEERLGQSFKLVSERLEAVQKGLGEMQTLANGVGDLKKVLSNVKTRGVLGEIQLGSILDQLLAPEQYGEHVKTKANSNDHVEYAIKMPGKDDALGEVWLPIDAKFPQEDYIRLQDAYQQGDAALVEVHTKALQQSVKKFAKDIRDKYIDPPHTTDFGILFLPIEGLFAEIVRIPDLVATLQRDYKIIVTGPTTLAAMLNSLQMGFRTLAIQKRSSEVWQILGAVKNEFGKFGVVLQKAQKKIDEANKELDLLVHTRTRLMLSKLKNVEALTDEGAQQLLDDVE